jgi:hypothetical protein
LAHNFRGSVHGHMVPLFLGYGEAGHRGGEWMVKQNCSTYGSREAKSKTEKLHAPGDLLPPTGPTP